MSSRGRQGNTLGGTILAVAILAALAAGLANLCVSHLRLSSRANNAYHASNLARSAIAAGIAKVAETPEWGTADGPPERTIRIVTEQGEGLLTFSPEDSEASHLDLSVNNIGNTESVESQTGGTVEADCVHLIARGVSNGVERRIETVIKVPSYPWAVAAQGEVEITTGATVGALPSGVWPPTPDVLEPADLVSNSDSSTSITLSGSCRVLGNVESPGGVVLNGDGVVVEGEVRQGGEPSDIPELDADNYDPARRDLTFENIDSYGAPAGDNAVGSQPGTVAPSDSLYLTGAARRSSDLVVNGDLRLDAASLFVDGDLTVNGNLVGHGVLIVKGDLVVNAGVALQGATQLAVLAEGSVTMQGVGPASTIVRGTFYAGGGVSAREMTVVGALIGGGESANVRLDNVSVYLQDAIEVQSAGPPVLEYISEGGWDAIENYVGDDNGSHVFIPPILIPIFETFPEEVVAPQGSTMAAGPSNFISMKERMKVVTWFER